MYLEIKNNKIKAKFFYNPKHREGYEYLEVPNNALIDEYSYYEDRQMKRKPQSEIDAIELQKQIEKEEKEKASQKKNILSLFGTKEYLLNEATFEEILEYRDIKERVEDTKNDLDDLEKQLLISKIDKKDFDLVDKTLDELREINNKFS